MDLASINADSWFGLFGSLGFVLISYVAKKYLIPFLQVGKRQKYAEYISLIADDIISELRQKYPEKSWLEHLDEAIATLAQICSVTPDIAQRAVKASAGRQE
jgi:hypothetical protein